ncbi:MAG: small subunit ribosomal protein [Solirubrobacteraceae bacterium]|nr:small subunit ribosomal protein [Solirubrobacteraceae bacterium]
MQRSAFGRLNMTLPAPIYDLVVLLDPQADDATRAKLVADTRASVEAQGELLRHDDWGERALAYPIDHKTSAQYHLLQFHVANAEMLGALDRTLRLADEVLRFRIIKLAPGVPPAPEMSSGAAAARVPEGAAEPPAEAVPEPVESAPAEPPAEAVPEPVESAPADPPAAEAQAAPAPAEAQPPEAETRPAQADAEVAVGEPS